MGLVRPSSRLCILESGGTSDDLDEFVSAVTTIVQSQCERWKNYADIETLVCHLPIDHLTFAAHDASAPYAGPYPMAIHVRAALLKEVNSWDETALHAHLRAQPSLRQSRGFERLPNQSTFWRAWNERFDERLRDAVQKSADNIVTAARACEVSLPDRIRADDAADSDADSRPEHQLVAEKTDEVWQHAKPFVTEEFFLKRGSNAQIHENAFWEQHAFMAVRKNMFAESGADSFYVDSTAEVVRRASVEETHIPILRA